MSVGRIHYKMSPIGVILKIMFANPPRQLTIDIFELVPLLLFTGNKVSIYIFFAYIYPSFEGSGKYGNDLGFSVWRAGMSPITKSKLDRAQKSKMPF
jgi:hypothetical protein